MSDEREDHHGSGHGLEPDNPAPRSNNPTFNPEACKAIDKFFSQNNQRQFRTYGEELAGTAPDAFILASGLMVPD